MSLKKDTLKINFKKGLIEGEVKALSFKEGEYHIIYLPSLNLSAYGDSVEEAHLMLKETVIPDFCKSALTKSRVLLFKELTRLGWVRSAIYRNELSRSTHIDKDGILREFDLSPSTVFEEESISVC